MFKKNPLNYYLLRPKYWLQLLILLPLKLITLLPLTLQVYLGKFIGQMMYLFAKRRRKIAQINLKLCFPDYSDKQRQALLKENFEFTGLGIVEILVCWLGNIKPRLARTRIIGKQHLLDAIAADKGVILLSFHMTSLEIGSTLLAQHFYMTAMYKPSKNKLSEDLMYSGRLRHVPDIVTQDDARATIKMLKNKKILWYAIDQNYGNKARNFSPFFGIQASTVTATSKFVKLTGAKVVPFIQRRLKDAKSYELEIYPAFDNFPGESEQADATRINLFLQNYLQKHPQDYMWLHQRFRTRPPGEPPIYPKKTHAKKIHPKK